MKRPRQISFRGAKYIFAYTITKLPDGKWKVVRPNGRVREFEDEQEARAWGDGGRVPQMNDAGRAMNERPRDFVMRFPLHTEW